MKIEKHNHWSEEKQAAWLEMANAAIALADAGRRSVRLWLNYQATRKKFHSIKG